MNPVRFKLILLLFLCAIVTGSTVSARDFVLVIDPGHGGKDVGARGVRSYEKNINLAVAKLFGERVKRECKDVKIVYTRETDRYVSLKDRAEIANKANGDLFVSIHVNSVAKNARNRRTVKGVEVYTLGLHRSEDNLAVAMRENSVMSLDANFAETYEGFDPESSESYIIFELSQSLHMDQSIEMAELVQQSLVNDAGRVDKGVRQAGFWVLWATSMPSILVELGFICNPNEETFLTSAKGQKKLADAIFNGFITYKKNNDASIADLE